MYKLIAFDLDGTILNTLEDLCDSVNYVLEEFGFPQRTLDEVRCFVGNGVLKLIERAVPSETNELTILKVFNRFSEYYLTHSDIKTRPYEGILGLLNKLKIRGYKIAVVSNKIHPVVEYLCDKYFPRLIDYCLGDDPIRPKKPHPDMLNYAMKKLGINKKETLYIGDSDVDVLTAQNTGVDVIGVEWGFRNRESLINAGAQKTVSNPQELLQLLIEE